MRGGGGICQPPCCLCSIYFNFQERGREVEREKRVRRKEGEREREIG